MPEANTYTKLFCNVMEVTDYSLFTLTSTSAIKDVNCVECKLLHCECKAFRGVDYQSMPLQYIGVFWFYRFPTCNWDDFGIKRSVI